MSSDFVSYSISLMNSFGSLNPILAAFITTLLEDSVAWVLLLSDDSSVSLLEGVFTKGEEEIDLGAVKPTFGWI